MSATFVEAFRQSGSDPIDSDWLGWLRRELAPTSARKIRTAIIVAGAVLCVVISMTLQVPQLATSAYMVFFISKESKLLTTITGVGGVIVLTIGIGATLLLYKFTYGHPELRIPGMAIALFFGMWLSRALTIGPLGFLLGFVVAVSQSDWSGIHTAFITCTFIALESTEATLYKGTLRIVGCVIGGALALFS